MPPSRPYWKGYLKLSLVSCPIALYTATSSAERVAFRQINKKTGNRLRQQAVDEGTGELVEAADKGRGHEVRIKHRVALKRRAQPALRRRGSARPGAPRAARPRTIGAIVIAGGPRAFAAGADISAMSDWS